ncbi:DUF5805 domain-containing protein [Halorientalis regularis]|jgi:hypothetical protein|uniref:Uncharacterized protein n=1 Tax=Halorientalis regularis TaxID=660518 RepID=A0A1G7N7X4_9EURY|nr:DUF5805 domain-containing protein [Halorientalis regularis]SDF70036.1 hypothetical protein SAMN05216218_108212 [Halorientalis regularis]
MSADGDVDTSRASVRTYVPAYQKEEWDRQADRMDMSLSEFVRSMVQAGRRGFEGGIDGDTSTNPSAESDQGLEAQIVAELRERGCCSWDDLVTAVTDDIESELERTLQESQRIQHSPRQGGYVLEDR